MPRRANGLRHPALAHQKLKDDIQRLDEAQLIALPGWESFSTLQKKMLAVLPWCASQADAYRFVEPGISNSRIKRLQDHHPPHLKLAARERESLAHKVVMELGADLLGLSMFWLQHYLQDRESVSDAQRMKAIELIFKVNRVGDEERPMGAGTVINAGQVNLSFTRNGSEREKAIPVEATVVD